MSSKLSRSILCRSYTEVRVADTKAEIRTGKGRERWRFKSENKEEMTVMNPWIEALTDTSRTNWGGGGGTIQCSKDSIKIGRMLNEKSHSYFSFISTPRAERLLP